MLEATVGYAGVREQFGRPIGSFQAVKHACADMLVEITVGRELLGEAVRAVCREAPTEAGDAAASVAVSMAKAYLCQAAVEVAGKAMQLHGGYGYTWESGIHTYLKRAVLNRSLFGAPQAHRRRLAVRIQQIDTDAGKRTPDIGGAVLRPARSAVVVDLIRAAIIGVGVIGAAAERR